MQIVINFILAINVIVSLLIILLVLMQRPKNEGLGAAFGGGMTENLFGAQTTNVLSTITRWLGAIFFGLTLLVSWLIVKKDVSRSSLQQRLSAPTVIPATPAPAIPKDVPITLPEAASAPVKPGEPPSTQDLEKSLKKAIDDAVKAPMPVPAAPEPAKPAPEGTPTPAPEATKPAPAPDSAPTPAPEAAKPAPAPESAPAPAPEAAKPAPMPAAPEAAKPAPESAPAPAPEAAKPSPAPEAAKPADAPIPTPDKAPEAPKP